MASSDVTGYSTHVRGALKPVVDSLSIVLYNKLNFGFNSSYRKITIYNINSILNELLNGSDKNKKVPYVQLDRKAIEGVDLSSIPFKYKSKWLTFNDGRYESGFNVIIYLDWKGDAVGYTEFNIVQGIYNDLDIKLQFVKDILYARVKITLANSLSPVLQQSLLDEISNLKNLNEYTTSSLRILQSINKLNKKSYYSDTIGSLMCGNKTPVYVPGVNIVSDLYNPVTQEGDDKWYSQGMCIGANVNPYLYQGFNNISLGFYNGDLALYMIEEGRSDGKFRYCACGVGESSLSIFSNPVFYNNISNLGYSIITPPTGKTIEKVEYGAGGYFVCLDSSGKNLLYDIRTESWIIPEYGDEDSGNLFIDPFDVSGRIVKVKAGGYTRIDDMCRDFPVIANLYKYHSLNPNASHQIIRIIGSWIILREIIYINGLETNTYFISSPSMCIQLSKEELDGVLFINDSSILIKNVYKDEESEETFKEYYTFYSGNSVNITELEYARVHGLDMVLYNNMVYLPDEEERMEYWTDNYESGLISIIYSREEPINKTVLNKYRRGVIPKDENGNILSSIPDIIGSFGGLMFYLDENKELLKYL